MVTKYHPEKYSSIKTIQGGIIFVKCFGGEALFFFISGEYDSLHVLHTMSFHLLMLFIREHHRKIGTHQFHTSWPRYVILKVFSVFHHNRPVVGVARGGIERFRVRFTVFSYGRLWSRFSSRLPKRYYSRVDWHCIPRNRQVYQL